MSKVKKVLCFVLALAMVFALAVPAFAADGGDEGIEPQGVWVICPNCGNSTAQYDHTDYTPIPTGKTRSHNGHTDRQYYYRDWFSCSVCGGGYVNKTPFWVCP